MVLVCRKSIWLKMANTTRNHGGEAGHMNLFGQEVRFGPHLMKDRSQVFQLKWQREINKLGVL